MNDEDYKVIMGNFDAMKKLLLEIKVDLGYMNADMKKILGEEDDN